MNSSLSILLPVRNAQATLAADVAKVLELLPDLTPRFDVLIVDDGSTDATYEIAHDLTIQYPQVRMLRNAKPCGREAALLRGLEQTSAEVVLGHVGGHRLDAKEIERMLGTLGAALPSIGNRSARRIEPISIPAPHAKVPGPLAGQTARPSRLISWLHRRGLTPIAQATLNGCFQILRGQAGRALELPVTNLGIDRRRDQAANSTAANRAAIDPAAGHLSPPRPNFLSRVKDFALGE